MFGVVTLVFFLLHLIPGDPVDAILGENAAASDREALRHHLGLDRPLPEQYARYISGVVQGDLGVSIHSRRPVFQEILERFPASAELMAGAMLVALLIALPLGIVSALKPYGMLDGASMLVSFLGISIPNFWLGPLLILLFSIHLGWLPVNERGGLEHLVLPAITLGTAMAAMLARMIRSSLLEVLSLDYIRTARAKGLSETRVVLRHGLRNALIPVITIVGLQVGGLLSGAIITESIFDWPGLGTLLLGAISSRDYPLVQGCILVISVIYVVVNLLADLAYSWADPRVRLQ
jgi:peptide/nickel transport system permease protein